MVMIDLPVYNPELISKIKTEIEPQSDKLIHSSSITNTDKIIFSGTEYSDNSKNTTKISGEEISSEIKNENTVSSRSDSSIYSVHKVRNIQKSKVSKFQTTANGVIALAIAALTNNLNTQSPVSDKDKTIKVKSAKEASFHNVHNYEDVLSKSLLMEIQHDITSTKCSDSEQIENLNDNFSPYLLHHHLL